jgi:transcriptional antiterminator RfaH
MNDNEPPWGVAVTRSNCERMVEDFLRAQEVETYLPRYRERGREQLLFTRYIFVRLADQWHVVLRTLGVVDFLRSGVKPAAVPDSVIADLKAREDRKGFVRLPPPLKDGQRVRVKSGPFRGQIGIYKGMTSRQRESVLLSSLGCRLSLSPGNLEII